MVKAVVRTYTRPERLSPRARAYVSIGSGRHLLTGWFCVMHSELFQSSSYEGLRQAIPFVHPDFAIPAWGFVFLFTGMMCLGAAIHATEELARWALLLSVVTTACVAGGFLAAMAVGVSAGPTGPVIWGAIALKDLTMLRAPMRNPFEPVMSRVLANSTCRE